MTDDRNIPVMGYILLVSRSAVISMPMGYNTFIYREPSINIHICLFAVNTFFNNDE